MLDDRPYMRQPTFDSPKSMAVVLVLINVAIWFVTLFVNRQFAVNRSAPFSRGVDSPTSPASGTQTPPSCSRSRYR